MLATVKRRVHIRHEGQDFIIPEGADVPIPEEVIGHWYFDAHVSDGTILLPEGAVLAIRETAPVLNEEKRQGKKRR
jgi:hypothetical protein